MLILRSLLAKATCVPNCALRRLAQLLHLTCCFQIENGEMHVLQEGSGCVQFVLICPCDLYMDIQISVPSELSIQTCPRPFPGTIQKHTIVGASSPIVRNVDAVRRISFLHAQLENNTSNATTGQAFCSIWHHM